MRWLRSLRFDDPCSQAVFVDYLSGVEMLVARRAALLAALEQVIPDSRHARRSPRCAAFAGSTRSRPPGCAPRSATGSASGPSSCRGSWGSSRASTPPTPSAGRARSPRPGSVHARRLLVEAAHHYRHQPAVGDGLARRQHGQDPRVIEISWRAQRRLHQRWQRPAHASAASPPASSRSPAPASSPRSAGRPPPSTERPADIDRATRCCRGARENHRASRSSRRAVRDSTMGNHRPHGPVAAPASRPRTATNTGS